MADELTFYPSLDGIVWNQPTNVTWATLHDALSGTGANTAATSLMVFEVDSSSTIPNWDMLRKMFLLFDTSELPNDCNIIGAILYLYGSSKTNTFATLICAVNIFSSNPASDVDLHVDDYDQLGTTPFCDTPIAYGDWDAAGLNVFVLNAAGLAAISKIGITKLGVRESNFDAPDIPPAHESAKYQRAMCYMVEEGGIYRPKLVVTYEEPSPPAGGGGLTDLVAAGII